MKNVIVFGATGLIGAYFSVEYCNRYNILGKKTARIKAVHVLLNYSISGKKKFEISIKITGKKC